MKKLLKIALLFVFAATFSMVTSSCGKDTCYECTGFDDGMGNSLDDLGEVCEGDDDGSGGTLDGDALETAVSLYEALGGTCNKK